MLDQYDEPTHVPTHVFRRFKNKVIFQNDISVIQ